MRFALLMSAAERNADGGVRRSFEGLLARCDDGRVTVVEVGPPMHDAETATTVSVDGRGVLLADRPAVPLERAIDAFCIVEAAECGVVVESVAAMPAVAEGAVVEIRPVVDSPFIPPIGRAW